MNWKSFEHLWEISDSGKVRNRRTQKYLKLRMRKDGYIDVKLNYKRYLVHRLVALLFIENPENLQQVNHRDGQRNNPRVENLEWVNQYQNMRHAIETGLFPDREGERNGRATITKAQALLIKSLLSEGFTMKYIAMKLNLSYTIITNIKYGKAWSYL